MLSIMAESPSVDLHSNSSLDLGVVGKAKVVSMVTEYQAAMIIWKYCSPPILVVGVVGSMASILVLCQRSMRQQTTMFYLAVLGVADLSVLLLGLLRLWLEKRFDFYIRLQSDLACKLHTFCVYVCLHFSVWILVAVSVDRCLFISLPHKARVWCTLRTSRLVLVSMVLVLVAVNSHFLWTYRREVNGSTSIAGNALYRCYYNSESANSERFVENVWPWIDLCVYCLVPFVVMLASNVIIARHLLQSDRKMAAHRHRALSERTREAPSQAQTHTSGPASRGDQREGATNSMAQAHTNGPATPGNERGEKEGATNSMAETPVEDSVSEIDGNVVASRVSRRESTGSVHTRHSGSRLVNSGVAFTKFKTRTESNPPEEMQFDKNELIKPTTDNFGEINSEDGKTKDENKTDITGNTNTTEHSESRRFCDSCKVATHSKGYGREEKSGNGQKANGLEAPLGFLGINTKEKDSTGNTIKQKIMSSVNPVPASSKQSKTNGDHAEGRTETRTTSLNTEPNNLRSLFHHTSKSASCEETVAHVSTKQTLLSKARSRFSIRENKVRPATHGDIRAVTENKVRPATHGDMRPVTGISANICPDAGQTYVLECGSTSVQLANDEDSRQRHCPRLRNQVFGGSEEKLCDQCWRRLEEEHARRMSPDRTHYASSSGASSLGAISTVNTDTGKLHTNSFNCCQKAKTGEYQCLNGHSDDENKLAPLPCITVTITDTSHTNTTREIRCVDYAFDSQHSCIGVGDLRHCEDNIFCCNQSIRDGKLNSKAHYHGLSSNTGKQIELSHYNHKHHLDVLSQKPYIGLTSANFSNKTPDIRNNLDINFQKSKFLDVIPRNSNKVVPLSNDDDVSASSLDSNIVNHSSSKSNTNLFHVPIHIENPSRSTSITCNPSSVEMPVTEKDTSIDVTQDLDSVKPEVPMGYIRRALSLIHNSKKAPSRSQPARSGRQGTASISFTLLMVNALFWILNAPVVIYVIGLTYWDRGADVKMEARLELAWAIVNILQYANNAAHIFLYCLTGPRFRKELWNLIKRVCVKKGTR